MILGLSWPRQQRISPVIPLALDRSSAIPLLSLALMEDVKPLRNKRDVAKKIDYIEDLREDLIKAKHGKRKTTLAALFNSYLVLQNYYVKLIDRSQEDRQKVKEKLRSTRRNIVKVTNKISPLVKGKRAKARVTYHKHVARYFLADSEGVRTEIVQELAKNDNRFLAKNLRYRAQLLIALQLKRGSEHLRKYLHSGNKYIAIVAHLGTAKSGRKKVFNALFRASSKAANLTILQRKELLAFSIRVWRKASGKKQDWNTPPLDLKHFRDLKETKSLIERSAISDWYQGNKKRAIEAYYKLARDKEVKEYSQLLYKQYLFLSKLRYTEARNAKHFDDALHRLHRDYVSATDKKEAIGGLSLDYLKKTHLNFVMTELQKSPPKQRKQIINIAKKLALTYPETKVKLYEEIAVVFAKMNAHDRSANTYLTLVRDTPHKEKYLRRAIVAQSKHLHYSPVPNFKRRLEIPARDIAGFTKLRLIYKKLDSTLTKTDWIVKSHLGLLYIADSKESAAASLWNRAVVNDPDNKYAKKISVHLLAWYETREKWEALEKISRLLIERKVSVPATRALPVYLAKSLLNQGINAHKKGNYKTAITKFVEYKTFKKEPHQDFATYQLSRLYKKTKQYKKFFSTLISYIVNYPEAKHYRQSLLEGAHYANIMAEEDNTIYFYRKFLQRFKNTKEELGIRKKLISLYQAKGNYYDAIGELNMLHKSDLVKAKDKVKIAQKIVELEFKHGNVKNVTAKINWIIADYNASDRDRGTAYYYKTSLIIGQRKLDEIAPQDFKQLLNLEKVILRAQKKARGKRHYNDAIALIALVKAEKVSIPKVTEDEVLRSPNINGLLQARFKNFNAGKSGYLQVCRLNKNNLCVNSLYQLARFSEKYLTNMEKIKIADTLSDKKVLGFNRRKNKMINMIKNTIRSAHNKSLQMTKEGRATPLVADQVTWMAKNELDFRSMDSSNYFQFSK